MNKVSIDDVLSYATDCIINTINCCQRHKWACERFLNDYEATQNNTGDYIYKWGEVEQVINWANLFKHTKGVLAGKYIELPMCKIFIVANIYGFYDKKTGYRRFKKLYLQEARKNMKSQFLAIICSYELMVFSEGMSEVYCAATKREQAKIVYSEVSRILLKCDALKGKWKEAYSTITHLKSGSELKSLSQEDKKFGDGLNPQCASIDEYHAHSTSEVLDVVESGMGARPEPLLAIITTAGFDLACPCYVIEYKMVSRMLNPDSEVKLEHVFADIHELEINETPDKIEINGKKIAPGDLIDDPNDPTSWEKANPVVCSYPEGIKYLKEKAKEMEAAPEKRRNFFTKHLNVWVNQRDSGYMDLAKWGACATENLPSLAKKGCYVGLDLSSSIDLTAAGLVFPFEIGDNYFYIIIGKAFMPELTYSKHVKTDKTSQYPLWEEQGWLGITKGATVDYKEVVEWVIRKVTELDAYIEEWDVDAWGATKVSSDLIDEGYEVVDIVQGPRTLSEPTKEFRNAVYDKRVIHDGNPVLTWCIGNAVAVSDRNENIILSKQKSTRRIDLIAAVLNSFTRAFGNIEESHYNRNAELIRSL